MSDLKEYRDGVMTHLMYIREHMERNHEYIKEKVDANHKHLEKLNGRVQKTESNINTINTVGSTFVILVTFILSYLGIKK